MLRLSFGLFKLDEISIIFMLVNRCVDQLFIILLVFNEKTKKTVLKI